MFIHPSLGSLALGYITTKKESWHLKPALVKLSCKEVVPHFGIPRTTIFGGSGVGAEFNHALADVVVPA